MNPEQRINEYPRYSALLFAGLAAILFHPFFLGKFVVGGTDVLYTHYPNILFGYREFHEFGAFSLWNRYIFAGTDFTGSMHAHYLNPLYWPLLLFPEKYIFHALTAGFMVMNALTGWVWNRIAVQRGVQGAGSLMVGVVAQAGMFFWFAMTTMISVPMYLCASIAIYLIITHEARGGLANYLALSLVLGMLFITPHPAYILGFLLPVIGLFVVKAYPGCIFRPWQGLTAIFAAACITALLLAAYRLVPVAVEIATKGAALANVWLPEYANHAYFGLTAFNPLALGINLSDSQIFSRVLHLAGHHTQIHNALYFGIPSLVIAYTAIRAGGSRKLIILAAAYIGFQFAYLFVLQPLSDIIYLMFYPLGHEGVFRPATAIVFLFLLIESLRTFASVPARTVQKAMRECVVISGVAIAAWCAMYAKVLFTVPAAVREVGFPVFVNGFRTAILVIVICAALISFLSPAAYARSRFGLVGVTAGGLAVTVAIAAATAAGLLPGAEMAMEVFKNGLFVILACFAILLAGFEPSNAKRKTTLVLAIAAAILFLLPMPVAPVASGLARSAWAAAIGWGVFVALLVMTLNILGRFASREMNAGPAVKLVLVLTVVDLVAAYGNYSYVNVPSSPFVRHMADVYPTRTPPARLAQHKTAVAEQSDLRNLLVNPELRLVSGQLADWSLGGKDMATCAHQPANSTSARQWSAIRLCYPGNDGNGNLYQDVALEQDIRQVAMGAWVLADPGMVVGLFLTSPSGNVGGPVARHRGDGKWHWIQATLQGSDVLKTVRPHINVAKAGHIEVYAPRLVAGTVVRSALRPADGHEIAELKDEFPPEIDLASYRVNHVHLINKISDHELMTNFAMVAKTPTYAGVDSDLSADYGELLRAFRLPDPSWYHRAGLYSSLEDERLLDLLGVGYDARADGGISFRPNAIPRFAAFSDFEVQGDAAPALQRLKAADFDPTTTVLLRGEPALSHSHATLSRFRLLHYETPAADRLKLRISGDVSRLILFNDRFSSSWEAYWNGKPLHIIPANFAFMAVALPEGAGELSFVFNPRLFIMLAKVSALTAVLLLLGSVLLLWSSFGRDGVRRS